MRKSYRKFPSFQDWVRKPLDVSFWDQSLARLEAERSSTTPGALKQAVAFVTRLAAVDTSAIEGFYEVDRGFTYSVANEEPGWREAFAERTPQGRSMFEAQLRASALVEDAATERLPVVEAVIRALHESVCAAQDTYRVWTSLGWQDQTLEKGAYKQHPNNPRTADGSEHAYAPVEEVGPEMARLVGELQTEAFVAAPAPIQAAYVHYAFVTIHPFADGNGRVARALASIYLVRAAGIPLLIFADQKNRYLDALTRADAGDYVAFSRFVRDQSIAATNLLEGTLERARQPQLDTLREQASRLYFGAPEVTHEQVDSMAERLLAETVDQVDSTFERLGLPRQLTLTTKIRGEDTRRPPAGYRKLGKSDAPVLEIVVGAFPIAAAQVGAFIRPLVSRDGHQPNPIRLEEERRGLSFDVGIHDLAPEIAAVVHVRLATWIESLLVSMVREALERGQSVREASAWNAGNS